MHACPASASEAHLQQPTYERSGLALGVDARALPEAPETVRPVESALCPRSADSPLLQRILEEGERGGEVGGLGRSLQGAHPLVAHCTCG